MFNVRVGPPAPFRFNASHDFKLPRGFQWNTARSEAPSPKHQASTKLQISSSKPRSERCGGHPGRCVEVWTLELLLIKSLVFWDLKLSGGLIPSKTAKNRFQRFNALTL
jgi:hypothetical protein